MSLLNFHIMCKGPKAIFWCVLSQYLLVNSTSCLLKATWLSCWDCVPLVLASDPLIISAL